MLNSEVDVLIVEDEVDLIDVISETLQLEGLRVASVCRPSLAAALVKSANPRFLIVDLQMPEMDGISLMDELEGNGMELSPRILMTSQHGVDFQRAYRAGFSLVVKKPFLFRPVVAAASQVIRIPRSNQKRMWIRVSALHEAVLGSQSVEVVNLSCGGVSVKIPQGFDAKSARQFRITYENRGVLDSQIECVWNGGEYAGYQFVDVDSANQGELLRVVSELFCLAHH